MTMENTGYEVPTPARGALALAGSVETALGHLAAADCSQLSTDELAGCLKTLERADAAMTVARSRFLRAFEIDKGHSANGAYSPSAWMMHQTSVTRAEARGHVAWARRTEQHPKIAAAMARGTVSRSWALKLCRWTDMIPVEHRQGADEILVTAAEAGADLEDLAAAAARIAEYTVPRSDNDEAGHEEPERDDGFQDRQLRIDLTLDGAGVLHGDLTPECANAVRTVLDALAQPRDKDDKRSHQQRYHDALHEAMTRLLGSDLLPKRDGQPTQAIVHISLADLVALDPDSVVQQAWIQHTAAQFAALQARASTVTGDGGLYLTGSAARRMSCDMALFPIVTGTANLDALRDLINACARYHRAEQHDYTEQQDQGGAAAPESGTSAPTAGFGATDDLLRKIIGLCADVMSGDGGLAAHLRRGLVDHLGLGGRSLPLDVGDKDDIPWQIRLAVRTRDQHCRWSGGCDQPALASQPHHLVHRSDHGPTSLANIYLYCFYHHHIAIHCDGWNVRSLGDGTLEARSPDGSKVYRGPPLPRPRLE